MMMPGNGIRGGGARGANGIAKNVDRIMDCIAYAAVALDYPPTLSFKTLIRAVDDFDIFEDYITVIPRFNRSQKKRFKGVLLA